MYDAFKATQNTRWLWGGAGNAKTISSIFFLQVETTNAPTLTDDKCPHRGGPLHLCYKDGQGKYRCPWHDNLRPPAKPLKLNCGVSIVGARSTRSVQVVTSAPIKWAAKYVRQTFHREE